MRTLLTIIAIVVSISANAQKKEKTYKVLAACGQCQFGMSSSNGCALAIKAGGKTYWVDGSSISDHGNEHAADGMCKCVKKAEIKGEFIENRFRASSFVLIPEKQKKDKK